MSVNLDNETSKQLKCSICSCYLSVGPITSSNNGYCCGRCHMDDKQASITIFTALAKICKFPCRYDVQGCNMLIPFGNEMEKHEKICLYRTITCPVKCNCDWHGHAKDLLTHCEKKHKENITKSLEFEMDLMKSMETLKIVSYKNRQVLVLDLMYNERRGLIVELSPIVAEEISNKYDLNLTSTDKTNSIELQNNEIEKPAKALYVPTSAMKRLNEKKIFLTFTVHSDMNHSFCITCESKISLYFYSCTFNHYLCGKCYKNKDCGLCKNPLIRKSNHQAMMEKNTIPFGCCNAIYECNFAGTVDKLQQHEKDCFIGKCLVYNCNWYGVLPAFKNHIQEKHSNITKHRQVTLMVNQHNDNAVVNFLSLSDDLFVVETKLQKDEDLLDVTVNSFSATSNKWKVMITLQDNAFFLIGDVVTFKKNFGMDYSCTLRVSVTLLQKYSNFRVVLYHTL